MHGPALEIRHGLRRNRVFRRARFDMRAGAGELTQVLVGIGQMHPVLHGHFEGFQARRIADVQAWIFHACRELHARYGVNAFGQEGFSADPSAHGLTFARVEESLLQEWQSAVGAPDGARRFLRGVARRWRRALGKGDVDRAGREALALNALSLLQAVEPGVRVFPIEQRDVHGTIGAELTPLQTEMDRMEALPAYLRARAKGGKGLSREEYDAAVRHRRLVEAFNQLLSHSERDRSIFREALRFAEKSPFTVYVLGQAHRRAQLHLAAEHLPEGTLFLWITPPSLWWWKAMLARVGWVLLAAGILAGIWMLR
jgi:hypothetical protein